MVFGVGVHALQKSHFECHGDDLGALIGTPIDRLPYTESMDKLVALVRELAPGLITHWKVWWGLLIPFFTDTLIHVCHALNVRAATLVDRMEREIQKKQG